MLTPARSGEVRFAQWSEINREKATWQIPAERMKARRDHRVPLVPRTLEILEHAEGLSGGPDGGLIFPADRGDTVLSDMVFTVMLRRLEIPAVPHGFRRSFKSWATETKAASWYEGEAALAHSIGDSESSRAYVDTDLLEPRIEMMGKWATSFYARSWGIDCTACIDNPAPVQNRLGIWFPGNRPPPGTKAACCPETRWLPNIDHLNADELSLLQLVPCVRQDWRHPRQSLNDVVARVAWSTGRRFQL